MCSLKVSKAKASKENIGITECEGRVPDSVELN